MQRINYFKILVTLVIAGLILFAALRFDSQFRENTKRERILGHIEHSLRCYRSLEEGTAQNTPEAKPESNDASSPEDGKTVGCVDQQGTDETNRSLSLVGDLLESIEQLKDLSNNEVDGTQTDAGADVESFKVVVERQLAELKTALPFNSLWIPEFSFKAYDSLTTSGNLYAISSPLLIEKLTELQLAKEQLELLDRNFQDTVASKLQPAIVLFDSCQSTQPESVDSTDIGCSGVLADQNFTSTIQKLKQLIVRAIVVREKAESSRHEAIAFIHAGKTD